MKAVVMDRYGTTDVLELKEVETPAPEENEMLIRIMGSAVTSTDPVFRSGSPFISRLFTGLLRPKHAIPGDVLSGEIAKVGRAVTKFAPGEQVFAAANTAMGGHAEHICLSEADALARKPANIDHGEAAAVCDGALTALPFLRDKAELKKDQTILIIGASGSIGTFAVQLAKRIGAETTAVCSTPNLELVKSLGTDHVIDYLERDFTQEGKQYDVIFDAVGKSSFRRCKASLTPTGTYMTTVPALRTMARMLITSKGRGKRAVFAATGLRPSEEKARDLEFLRELVESGEIRVVVDRTYSLDQIGAAHAYVEQGHKKGNVLLSIE